MVAKTKNVPTTPSGGLYQDNKRHKRTRPKKRANAKGAHKTRASSSTTTVYDSIVDTLPEMPLILSIRKTVVAILFPVFISIAYLSSVSIATFITLVFALFFSYGVPYIMHMLDIWNAAQENIQRKFDEITIGTSKKLVLDNNDRSERELEALKELLDSGKTLPVLEEFTLHSMKGVVGGKLAYVLCKIKTERLNLVKCSITNGNLVEFSTILSQNLKLSPIKVLDVSQNRGIIGKRLAEVVKILKSEQLILKGCKVTKNQRMDFVGFLKKDYRARVAVAKGDDDVIIINWSNNYNKELKQSNRRNATKTDRKGSNTCNEVKFVNEKLNKSTIASILKVLQQQHISTLAFKSCEFRSKSFHQLLEILSIHFKDKQIELLEISKAANLNNTHALALGQFIKKVNVLKLDIHGSNLKQYIEVFKKAMNGLPKEFKTMITFETDEVDFTLSKERAETAFGHSGCKMVVPSYAVNDPVDVSLNVNTKLVKFPGKLVQVTPIVQCLPSGLRFLKPVTFYLSTWCTTVNYPLEMTVFTREDENDDWKKECNIQHTGGSFISFNTNHFSDFGAGTSADATCRFKVITYTPIFTSFEDDFIITTYCLPNNDDILNSINRENQALLHSAWFLPLRFKLNLSDLIKIEINFDGEYHHSELEEKTKIFHCRHLDECLMHESRIVSSLGQQVKRGGLKLLFKIRANERVEHRRRKAIWKEWNSEAHGRIVQSITNYGSLNIAGSHISNITSE